MTVGAVPIRARIGRGLAALAALLMPSAAWAADLQDPIDQADPAVIEESLRDREPTPSASGAPEISADPSRAGAAASIEPFTIGAVRIDGAVALRPADFAGAIQPWLGRRAGGAELRALAGDIAAVARRAGYGLATAWVPPQQVSNGILAVRLDEGRIDTVEGTGPAGPAVERLLRNLRGAPVRTAALERQLMLAGDLAGVTIGRARLIRTPTRNILRVETGRDRVRGRAELDNWGTAAIGPVRARLAVDIVGALAGSDRLTVGGIVTPLQPREFQLVEAGWSVPLGPGGTEASLRGYLSRAAAGGPLRERDLEGDGAEIEAGFSHPFVRSRAASLWGQLSLGLRDSALSRDGVRLRDDRIVSASATLFASGRLGGGQVRVRLSAVQGLDLLGATRRGDPLASRSDASGVFTKFTAWSDYARPLGRGFSVQLSSEAQLATRPLLATEEMGLGGRRFLRGYDYREFSGDRGAALAAELRFDLASVPRPLRRAQIYVYADAGRVANLRGGHGGGSLASAGGGLRLSLGRRLSGSVELGVPLADGAGAVRPSPRLSFTVSSTF